MSSAPFLPRGAAASSSSLSRSAMQTIGLALLALWLAVITGVFVTWNNDNTKAVTTGPGLTAVRSGNDVVVSDDFNTRMYTLPSSATAGSPCGIGFLAINPYTNGVWNVGSTFFTSTVGGGFNNSKWIPQYTGVYTGLMQCSFSATTFSGTDHFTVLQVITLNGTTADPYLGDNTRIVQEGWVHYFPTNLETAGYTYSTSVIFHVCPTCTFKANQPITVHMFPRDTIVAANIVCKWTVCQND